MSKATESKLEALHGAVATVLTAQIEHKAEVKEFDEDGLEVGTGEMVHTATPATIAAAIKFLKDNQITCDIENNTEMNNLRETLANKQRRSRLGNAKDAAHLAVVGEE
ncbi:MAG: hypothetical protein Unbinned4336contig1000_6 [Prokaryotic dsDNA virus sp.]|nr:MAG: hypothetical protein Unbinned4336contig1000_6 [Prokaryotic dsDNA virus sp.]|tara:strand:- start:39827 stop:40150 length:324 start_codon:yes stop_codon:yes gene_type:complete